MKLSRAKLSFTLITFIIGFMIAIQFQTVNEPVVRDTRDMWELRKQLAKEMEIQSKLLDEIRVNENRIDKYESEIAGSKEEALRQTLLELKKEAGLTEIKGTGIVLTVESLTDSSFFLEKADTVSPVILKRLINELNMYGAKHIAIDGERIINTSVIRDINGETKVGSHSLRTLPFDIVVITENKDVADKMYNRMLASPTIEDFFIDHLQVKISQPEKSIVVPAFVDPIRIRNMEPVHEKGES
ncbi:DUF881 domain-containing protein [Bacillus sp. FJAT-50079]|uniref:DUF881 domain-containing protein n=1 Tax=Bacillus sp. FJAT-50079 TaxID=2833577 RepID=UPI001BC9EBEC|nr:DUF881 domain-containing protein [Bacillus sp. FJAT-50079]MBS4207707.1 DUF881 domain-containing protein [Bacillus sp. FJAT-50079]